MGGDRQGFKQDQESGQQGPKLDLASCYEGLKVDLEGLWQDLGVGFQGLMQGLGVGQEGKKRLGRRLHYPGSGKAEGTLQQFFLCHPLDCLGLPTATAAVSGELFFPCLLQQDIDVIFPPSILPQSTVP